VISPPPGTKVYVACQPVDLRCGFYGLSAKVKHVLDSDPFLCVGQKYVADPLFGS
jgi:transposase